MSIEQFIESHTLHPHHRTINLGGLRSTSGCDLLPSELFPDELLLVVSGFRAEDDVTIVVVFFEVNLGAGYFAGSIRMPRQQWDELVPTATVLRGAPDDLSALMDTSIRFVPSWPTRLRVRPRDAAILAIRWRHGARPRMNTIALLDRADDHDIEVEGFHSAYRMLSEEPRLDVDAANAIADVLDHITEIIGSWDEWHVQLPELAEIFEEDDDGFDL